MKYTYKDMLDSAKAAGLLNDKVIWAGMESISDMLCLVKKDHPDVYWKFIREQHGLLHGNHYDEEFAMYDVEQLSFIDKEGKEQKGAHWTCAQIEDATRSMKFPAGTGKWDKFVAFNVAYSDFCKKYDETNVIEIAFLTYFADADWPTNTKIWDYMCLRSSLE